MAPVIMFLCFCSMCFSISMTLQRKLQRAQGVPLFTFPECIDSMCLSTSLLSVHCFPHWSHVYARLSALLWIFGVFLCLFSRFIHFWSTPHTLQVVCTFLWIFNSSSESNFSLHIMHKIILK